MNGAESLVKTLLASGVDVCFANPGTSGAADGYFRMSRRVAATLLHLAPGFGNAFANLHNARKAQSGVLNVMGEHATYHLRHESPLKGDTAAIPLLTDLCVTMKSGSLCALGGFTPYPVLSALNHFPADFARSKEAAE